METKTLCNICHEEVIYVHEYTKRDGTKVEAYYRHASGSGCSALSEGESVQHKQAKYLLVNFLNNGGELSIARICKWCNNKYHHLNEYRLSKGFIASQEVRYKNSILDVACCHEKEIELCLEVKHTHETENTIDRDELRWFEIDAIQILKEIPIAKKNRVTLYDIREYVCGSPECKSDYDLHELALALGYAQIEPETALLQEYKKARLGVKSETLVYSISFKKGVFATTLTWNKFLKLNQCLFCGKKHPTQKYKPYCMDCYQNIKSKEKVQHWRISPLQKGERGPLIEKFDWLREREMSKECVCGAWSRVWWFPFDYGEEVSEGGQRGLCYNCLETECEKRNL